MKALSRRQMLALMFVAMLSPFLRLIPRQVALFAGRAAWTAPFLAFVPLLHQNMAWARRAAKFWAAAWVKPFW